MAAGPGPEAGPRAAAHAGKPPAAFGRRPADANVLTEWEADLNRELSDVATRVTAEILKAQGQAYCDELRDWVAAFAARPLPANGAHEVDVFLAQQKQAQPPADGRNVPAEFGPLDTSPREGQRHAAGQRAA